MENPISQFFDLFNKNKIELSQDIFNQLSKSDQLAILEKLFQQSQFSRQPDMISVLTRELHDGKTFEDFHSAWLPNKSNCDPIDIQGETYQQFIPAPTKVINAININNPKEIISIGITWVDSNEQAEKMWEYGKNPNTETNQSRHNKIKQVADKTSANLYEPKSSDNLGLPFGEDN